MPFLTYPSLEFLKKKKWVIIIGIRRDNSSIDYQQILKEIYDVIKKNGVEGTKTVRDVLSDLPPIYPVENPTRSHSYTNDSEINGHKSRFHSERDKKIFHDAC